MKKIAALVIPGRCDGNCTINYPEGLNEKLTSVGGIISAFLPYIFVFAGLGLLIYLILGGFQLMTSGGDPKAIEQAKGKITGAVIGFIIIFVSYWLIKILQIVFGLPQVF
jgi:hypothetical protein